MKKITALVATAIAVVILITSCNETSKKEMGDASQNIKEANTDMKEAVIAANVSVKAAVVADWKRFRTESDTAIVRMEREASRLEAKIAKANSKEKETLRSDLKKTNEKLQSLKQRLNQRNIDFENELKTFDTKLVSKNQSFEREFKHDMDQLGMAFKDLFKNNVK